MTQRRYKTRTIRQLLIATYSVEELRTLCFDEFRPVYEDYNEAKKSELVRHLLEHCDRKGELGRLLELVAEDVPAKYAAYEDRLWENVAPTRSPSKKSAIDTPEQLIEDVLGLTQPTKLPTVSAASSPDTFTLTTPFKMEFVRVPAGEFLMGSDPAKEKYDLEVNEYALEFQQPQHSLYLPEFYIGKYPVTNAQFAVFIKTTKYEVHSKWQDGKFPMGGPTHPANYVSWPDVVAFCHWLEQAGGYRMRLPTEAEWEKAARGLAGLLYPWGNERPTAKLCNFGNDIKQTTPVGQYSPQGDSPFGTVDMAGNLWEWCSTIWQQEKYPFQVEDEWQADYLNRINVPWRVARGGAFYNNEDGIRCAFRHLGSLHYRDHGIGFRVVVSPFTS